MTPLFVEMVLNLYCCPLSPPHNGSNAATEAFQQAIKEGLFKQGPNRVEVTDRGRAYVAALLSVPLPTVKYVIEWPAGEVHL